MKARKYKKTSIHKHPNKFAKNLHEIQAFNAEGECKWSINLFTNNMSNGILPLTDETLHLLRTKHQEMQSAHEEVLLQGPIKQVHPVFD